MKLFLQLGSSLTRLSLLFLIFISFAVQAELPPRVYDEMKRDAPEVFVVRIEEAKGKVVVREKRQQFTYEAKVLRVIRTKSRIRPGGSIVIQSQHHIFGPGEVGPSNPRKLKKNDIVLAYLLKGQKVDEFLTAAGGHSFEQPKLRREGDVVEAPANPIGVELAPGPPVRVNPVRPRPDFPPPVPDDGPVIIGGPMMSGGGMGVPMMHEMPGRFEIIPVQLTQAGKPVPVVLKLDTQTGEVWQLKLTSSSFFLNGKEQVRTRLNFEPVAGDHNPRHNHEGRTMPGRPDIDRDETDVDEGEAIPERPRLRPRPIPVRPLRVVPEGRNLTEPAPRRDR